MPPNKSCKIQAGGAKIAMLCEKGYVAILDPEKIISNDLSKLKADKNFSMSQNVTDVWINKESSLAITTNKALYIYYQNVTHKVMLSYLVCKNNKSCLGYVFQRAMFEYPLLVAQILYNNQSSLYTFTLEDSNFTQFGLVSIIENNVTSFSIDLDSSSTTQYIYAVQELNKGAFQMVHFQMDEEAIMEYYGCSALDDCGTSMKLTKYFFIIACPNFNEGRGKVSIYLRYSMKLVKEVQGTIQNSYLGANFSVIESEDGLQLQIYSIVKQPSLSLSYIELVYNHHCDKLEDQYISNNPISFKELSSTQIKYDLSIAAVGNTLFALEQQSLNISAYMSCDYKHYLKQGQCVPCSDSTYQIGNVCYSCSQQSSAPSAYKMKLMHICFGQDDQSSPFILIMIITGCLLGFLTIGALVLLFCLKYRYAERHRQQQQEVENLQVEEEANLKDINLDFIDEKLPKINYLDSKNHSQQLSCCICCEDFKEHEFVRETKCLHVFHCNCIIEWIKFKIDKPHCPTCRLEIDIDKKLQ